MKTELNELKIYKSSAGSGKTFTLVKEYIRLVIINPADYKHILAITFTNKATEEMKSRIVDSLIELSENKNPKLAEMISEEAEVKNVQHRAQQALDFILHDYSAFSVCTIDSFFQKLIRCLAREIRLPLRLEVQMDQDEVIDEITALLLNEVGKDEELTHWLSELLMQKLADDKGWSIEKDIAQIAKELFKENSLHENFSDRAQIHAMMKTLRSIKTKFESAMKTFGEEGLKQMSAQGFSVEDFSFGKTGVAGYFEKIISNNAAYQPGVRVLAASEEPEKWYAKKSSQKDEIHTLAENTLIPILKKAIAFCEKEFPSYGGAVEVLKRIYLLGILHDLRKKLSEYRSEKNMLIISDTPKILSEYINADDAPFIFEKTGNRYNHFLIDEFQDTSDLQWKNILPLIINSLGSGNFCMVVGDAKQSIYRWRGGNMNLLATGIRKYLSNFNSIITEKNLDTNYRSKKNIVEFNNAFFRAVPEMIKEESETSEHLLLGIAYSDDVAQKVAEKNNEGGYVTVSFVEAPESEDETPAEKNAWKVSAMNKMLDIINTALTNNYSYRDIAILVRNNKEGDTIATFLSEHGIKKIISPDSLLLWHSPKIRFFISVFRFLADNGNDIARSEILYYASVHLSNNSERDLHKVFSDHHSTKKSSKEKSPTAGSLFEISNHDDTLFNKILPEDFTQNLSYLAKLPVYELCEQIISIFGLSKDDDSYMLRMLDLVLEYVSKHDASLTGFLFWWDESDAAEKISLIISENENAIRIMTIHRAKGLQFPIVIIPFADWKLIPDIRDVIWVESDSEPFNEFGKVPINPSKNLLETVFKKAFETETEHAMIDNINLLYVAFTRAEDELHIICPESEKEELKSVGRLVKKICSKQYATGDAQFTIGEAGNKNKKKKKVADEIIPLKYFPVCRWQDKLHISTRSGNLLEMLDAPASQKINYGILMHRILEVINGSDSLTKEIENAADEIYFEGLITEEEKVQLIAEIKNLFEDVEIKNFFSSDWEVKSEREIILPDGEILRPDRVVVKENAATVIDFKTGKESTAHETQVTRYAGVLKEMGYVSVEKYLIYISQRKIKKVE